MSEPFTFTSSTPNIGLPLLIAGQAQKEFFLNQSLVIVDSLHRRSVIASQPAPPTNADEGDCFRITAPATQEWEGCEDHITIQIGSVPALSIRLASRFYTCSPSVRRRN